MKVLLIIIGIIVFLSVIGAIWNYYRMKKIALKRGEPDICSYARSFNYREVDTKIMREVFNHVQKWAGKYEGIPFPVKAEDCFDKIYKMDPEDLDDIYLDIAKKLGISIEHPEKNPLWNKIKTVKDLVLFLHNQPRINKA